MSSQGPTGAHQIIGIQGDASNWTQSLKRQKTYRGLLGNTSGVRTDLLQSNQLQTDYRIGVAACGVSSSPYPKLPTGGGC
jgi:hypothetical protein